MGVGNRDITSWRNGRDREKGVILTESSLPGGGGAEETHPRRRKMKTRLTTIKNGTDLRKSAEKVRRNLSKRAVNEKHTPGRSTFSDGRTEGNLRSGKSKRCPFAPG